MCTHVPAYVPNRTTYRHNFANDCGMCGHVRRKPRHVRGMCQHMCQNAQHSVPLLPSPMACAGMCLKKHGMCKHVPAYVRAQRAAKPAARNAFARAARRLARANGQAGRQATGQAIGQASQRAEKTFRCKHSAHIGHICGTYGHSIRTVPNAQSHFWGVSRARGVAAAAAGGGRALPENFWAVCRRVPSCPCEPVRRPGRPRMPRTPSCPSSLKSSLS